MYGLVRCRKGLLKTEGMNAQDDFLILKRSIRGADCVDKGVVSGLIDLGLRYILDHESACFVADKLFLYNYSIANHLTYEFTSISG